jgi:hypothetical protein
MFSTADVFNVGCLILIYLSKQSNIQSAERDSVPHFSFSP